MVPTAIDPFNAQVSEADIAQPQAPDPKLTRLIDDVERAYVAWRTDRQTHELTWFVNTAMVRGAQDLRYNHASREIQPEPQSRERLRVRFNRLLQKYKARQSKFLKQRFTPQVLPFSPDREDKLNARATQRAFEAFHNREQVERKYRLALNWANTASKGFFALYWDPRKQTTIKITAEEGAPPQLQGQYDVEAGDVCVRVLSPFSVLVPDPGASSLQEQSRLMIVELQLVSDVVARYGDKAAGIAGDYAHQEVFQYQRQIAGLSARGTLGTVATSQESDGKSMDFVIVKELFVRPNGEYPRGQHIVVAGGKLLLAENELPYGLWDQPNPFPVVEFPDLDMPGQFWPPTIVEQLIDVQKAHNLAWAKVLEHLRFAIHPKVIVPVQAQWPKKAWTGGPGEVIEVLQFPGMPGPQVIQPPNISGDIWRILERLDQEFDKVTSLFPASMGQAGSEESGFQVNLLQEAADSVHAPDIRLHELAFEEFYFKVRRMMKWGYSVPRLLSITGRNSSAEVFEFASNMIDEHCVIKVFTGSALSSSPAIRTKQVQELWASDMLGPRADPNVQRKALKLIDAEGIGELQEESRRDEDMARRENDKFKAGALFTPDVMNGKPGLVPMPWENHDIHWEVHTDETKLPEFEDWTPEAKMELYRHIVWHARWSNPSQAYQLSIELGLPDLTTMLAPLVMQAAAPAPADPNAPQGAAAGAPQPAPAQAAQPVA
jgi:hypothetical protein